MLLLGLLTGMLFGFLLQKARVIRYDKQIGALRLIDMDIFKFMLSGIIVAVIGIYVLREFGLIQFRMRPLALGPNIIGGILFGIGWGLLGYCPGTAWGALGEGRWDALWGILGMLAAAALYAELFPFMQKTIFAWGATDIYTLPQLLDVNHWFVIPPFAGLIILLFIWFEKKGL